MKIAMKPSTPKNRKFKVLLFGLLTLFLFQTTNAHWGGHANQEGGAPLNTWVLADGSVLKANFSFSKGNQLFF